MKKKNSILTATTVFCIVIMGGVLLKKFEKQEQDKSFPIKESLIENVHQQALTYREKIFKTALPSKITKMKSYKNFMDSRMTVDKFMNTSRVGEVKEFVKATFKSLKGCYKEGCGQLPDEDDGFYDPALTVAQQSLRRLLEITERYPRELNLKELISGDDLIDLLNAENEDLRKVALRNLMLLKGNKKGFETILNQSRNLDEAAVATVIEGLVKYVNKNNKQDFVDTLSLIVREKNSGTILEMLRHLEGFSVSQDQISQISEGLCRFKGQKPFAHNLKAMNYYIKTMAKRSGILIGSANYCL